VVKVASIAGEKCDRLAHEVKSGPETEKHENETNNKRILGEISPQNKYACDNTRYIQDVWRACYDQLLPTLCNSDRRDPGASELAEPESWNELDVDDPTANQIRCGNMAQLV
jgi:hypothetical protein